MFTQNFPEFQFCTCLIEKYRYN